MTKLLFTGGSGFLGKNIIKKLEDYGFLISTLGSNSGDYVCNLSNSIPLLKEKFDIILHAAGKAHSIPKSEADRQQFYDVNVKGTINLLAGLKDSSLPKQFVYISSVSVYGREQGFNITEDFPLEAKDAYGLSKIKAEKIVQKWCHEHNVVCTILRLPLLVGKNPPGNLGAMIKGVTRGYYFNIGGGKAKKSMVLAEDVAAFIPTIANIGGVYNLTDGYHPSFFELSSVIALQLKKSTPFNLPEFLAKGIGVIGDLLGSKAPINSLKLKKITSDLTFDDFKAQSVGWKPRSVLEWYQSAE